MQEETDVLEINVFQKILELMNIAGTMIQLDGSLKKGFVLNQIKIHLGNETYERFAPILGVCIDGLVELSKNKKVLDRIKIVKKKCFICI